MGRSDRQVALDGYLILNEGYIPRHMLYSRLGEHRGVEGDLGEETGVGGHQERRNHRYACMHIRTCILTRRTPGTQVQWT